MRRVILEQTAILWLQYKNNIRELKQGLDVFEPVTFTGSYVFVVGLFLPKTRKLFHCCLVDCHQLLWTPWSLKCQRENIQLLITFSGSQTSALKLLKLPSEKLSRLFPDIWEKLHLYPKWTFLYLNHCSCRVYISFNLSYSCSKNSQSNWDLYFFEC